MSEEEDLAVTAPVASILPLISNLELFNCNHLALNCLEVFALLKTISLL